VTSDLNIEEIEFNVKNPIITTRKGRPAGRAKSYIEIQKQHTRNVDIYNLWMLTTKILIYLIMQVKVLMKKINEKHVRIVEKKDITELHVNSTRTSVIYLTVIYSVSK